MLIATLPLALRLTVFLFAGVAAGISNGIAGGGTFIIFPTMLAMGIPALQANVSSTVSVLPSFVGGIRSFRHELKLHRGFIRSLMPSCLFGTGAGTILLLTGSPSTFRTVVPWLIGGGTALFAFAPWITKRVSHVHDTHPARRWALYVGIFLVSVYGGYFGAGIGILLLAVMAITLPLDIKEIQGLRIVLSIVITSFAGLIFVIRGHLAWAAVGMFMIGTLLGGWLGTMWVRRLSPTVVRLLIIATGLITTVRLAVGG
jgi:uncharacterized membrane protein YfcA